MSDTPETTRSAPADASDRSGSALIVAIAILFVMIVLAVALLNISSGERKSSKAYTDQVQARILAFSGMEHVRSRLKELGGRESLYHGENWKLGDGDTDLSGQNAAVVNGADASGRESENGDGAPLSVSTDLDPRYALHPSFASTQTVDGAARPELVEIRTDEGSVYRGFSGRLPSSYGGGGADTYTLRIDAQSGLNVNSLNPRMGTVINRLCRELDACSEAEKPGGKIIGPFSAITVERTDTDADQIPERVVKTDRDRPDVIYDPKDHQIRGGYTKLKELNPANGGPLTAGNYRALKDHLAVEENVYVDTSVIRPLPQNTDITFDEDGDCPSDAGPYHTCRDEDGDGLFDAYPIPDNRAGAPKAVRGRIDDADESSLMTHTETIHWMKGPGGEDPGTVSEGVVAGGNRYGAFHYNFNYKRQPRAPVHVNSARREMLVSVVEGLRARVFEITQRPVSQPNGMDRPYIETRWFNPMYQTRHIPNPGGPNANAEGGLSTDLARRIVEEIVDYRNGTTRIDFRDDDSSPQRNYRGPFKTWPEFEAFVWQHIVRDVDGSMGGGVSNDVGYLLMAHFNPNTHFAKYNWDSAGKWTWISDGTDCSSGTCAWQGNRVFIDKTDFLYHTTEFSFLPPQVFSVSSYGRVLGPEKRIKAEASLQAEFVVARYAKHTTQADFEINSASTTFNMHTYPEAEVNMGTTVFNGTTRMRVKLRQVREDRDGDGVKDQWAFRSGSGLAGQLSVAPRRDNIPIDIASSDIYMNWLFDTPDESTRGRFESSEDPVPFTVRNPDDEIFPIEDPDNKHLGDENDPHWPYAWTTREFNDVSDDSTPYNAGVAGGKWDPDEHFNRDNWSEFEYPYNESNDDDSDMGMESMAGVPAPTEGDLDPSDDPYNYSDITADGALMTSDRYRSLRFLTTGFNDDGPSGGSDWDNEAGTAPDVIPIDDETSRSDSKNDNWAEGHVEFWWKPRAGTLSSDPEDPLSQQRTVYPLWHQFILSETQGMSTFDFVSQHTYHATGQDKVRGHTKTWQSEYAYKQDGAADSDYDPGNRYDPVTGTDGSVDYWYDLSGNNSDPFNPGGADTRKKDAQAMNRPPMDRPPLHEKQRWAGNDCNYEDPVAQSRYANGTGTTARLSPETGCPTFYPDVKYNDRGGTMGIPGGFENAVGRNPGQGGGWYRGDAKGFCPHIEPQQDGAPSGEHEVSGCTKGWGIGDWDRPEYQSGKWLQDSKVDRKYVSYLHFFDHTGHPENDPTNPSNTGPEYALGNTIGYYFRAYYVNPAGRGVSPKWVFKISMEGFFDMDVGLRKNDDPRKSPPITTDWRQVHWTENAMDLNSSESGDSDRVECHKLNCFMPGEVVATLNVNESSDPERAEPKPGKWTHVALEWDRRNMYDFRGRDGDGGGQSSTQPFWQDEKDILCKEGVFQNCHGVGAGETYPVVVPMDNSHFVVDADLGSNDGWSNVKHVEKNKGQPWLRLQRVPADPDKDMRRIMNAGDNPHQLNADHEPTFIVPHISVNGVDKTFTELHSNNVDPRNGQFQTSFIMYAEHVTWSNDMIPLNEDADEKYSGPRRYYSPSYFQSRDGNAKFMEGNQGKKHEKRCGMGIMLSWGSQPCGDDSTYPDVTDTCAPCGIKERKKEIWTGWYYIQHLTFKHYGQLGQLGSNLARRTKHYGTFDNSNYKSGGGGEVATYNWARFYDDGFMEGTIDEFYYTNVTTTISDGDPIVNSDVRKQVTAYPTFPTDCNGDCPPPERYEDPDATLDGVFPEPPVYTGRFHRAEQHDHGNETYWDTNSDGMKDLYNGYARADQHVLQGDLDTKLKIVRVAHTQYRPEDPSTGREYRRDGSRATRDDPKDEILPYFNVKLKSSDSSTWKNPEMTYNDSDTAPNDRWLGEPVTPKQLFGEDIVLDSGEELMYRLRVLNGRNPMNTTPFFEDILVGYRTGSAMQQLWFYTPD